MAKSSIDVFKSQLYNAITSCPIVYIHSDHKRLIDDAILSICETEDNQLPASCILEFDASEKNIINLDSKVPNIRFAECHSIEHLMHIILCPESSESYRSPLDPDTSSFLSKNNVFVINGVFPDVFDSSTIPLLQQFVYQYESGMYDPQTTIIIYSSFSPAYLPDSIKQFVSILEIKPPTVDEIREYVLCELGDSVRSDEKQLSYAEEIVRTLQGLQFYDVKQTLRSILAKSNNKRLRKSSVLDALAEKQRIVRKSGIIEVVEPRAKFSDIGGLKRLCNDLNTVSAIYKNLGEAVKHNVPIPKGILIIGMPGCGKSMIAQATAEKFGVSLLRLDVSRLMGKYVGESESNLRLALATAEAAHPCVLWIDEIEKAFAGTNSGSGENDMLVMRMMGHFLTWMQERTAPVYIVATANDVMKPELMRRGRFDEVYFVDFPTKQERAEILEKKILSRYPAEHPDCLFDFSSITDYQSVVDEMRGANGGFSGSEIECVLDMVIQEKFAKYLREKSSGKIVVTKEDFDFVVTRIKNSVMSNQKGRELSERELLTQKTAIEKIKEMAETYHFVKASK